ncbi:MAG: 4Fe-4S binding protein [Endomicrobium sp.]|jgi:ferredoxin|nr:4Fe-4S binding protein [Endomicrobium sp.]
MSYEINKDICVGCGACAGNCPVSAIEQMDDKYEIDSKACVDCGACESTCPVSAISKVNS